MDNELRRWMRLVEAEKVITEAYVNELFKAWYNASTDDSVNVPLFRSHADILERNGLQFDHADLPTALMHGWCRIGIDELNGQIIAFAQTAGGKNALRALRWLRKKDHSDWSMLRIDQGDGRTIDIIDKDIDRYLRTGSVPRGLMNR